MPETSGGGYSLSENIKVFKSLLSEKKCLYLSQGQRRPVSIKYACLALRGQPESKNPAPLWGGGASQWGVEVGKKLEVGSE